MIHTKLAATASLLAMLVGGMAQAQSLAELETAAKAEGRLSTIALPDSWCGYDKVIASFKEKYPEIEYNGLNPDAGSADEVEAIRANKDNKGPQAPDVIDVGLSFGPATKDDTISALGKKATGPAGFQSSIMPSGNQEATCCIIVSGWGYPVIPLRCSGVQTR